MKIVVLGGSFNPPTVAHYKLMQTAVDAIGADKGIFVPTANKYVLRKLKKQDRAGDTLSNEIRIKMLESFCSMDSRFEVSTYQTDMEEDTGKIGRDYYVLEFLQKKYPEAEIYFLVGSDKLFIIPHWHRATAFVERFRILVALRGEDNLEKIKEERPFIAEHWDSFEVFPMPEEIKEISSSAFREKLHNGDKSAKELVTDEVWNILNENGRIPWNAITDFHAEGYEFLSNFYTAPVTYQGLTFQNNEAAFQAQKTLDESEKLQFTEYGPGKSKGIGRQVALRPDWEEVKNGIMYEIVLAKFTQNLELADKLLATGDKVLVEGNRWNDTHWGVNIQTGQGKNHLGKILMRVRTELSKRK